MTRAAAGAGRVPRGGAKMDRIKEMCRRLREERGITGLETAIVLIAFVVVAAVFAFVVLSTGLFSSERSKETVYAGLAKTRGSMELAGSIIADSDGTKLTDVTFDLTLAAGGDQVNLNPTDPSNRTVISYVDSNYTNNNLTYTTAVITGNADSLLEQGELIEVAVDLTQDALINIGTNHTFTLEIKPPQGSYMVIQRTSPASVVQSVINLN
ncbi:MAG: flagellin [Dehalococcoidia bacterium]|nr:MAG: flagellin [Dehalococcoidia bacterium]